MGYEEANKFSIEKFLRWYNNRYSHKADSAYRALPGDKNLDTIFCIKKERTVKKDNTIQVCGEIIQIPPSNLHLSFANRRVDVRILENRQIIILYKERIVYKGRLSENNKILKKEKKIEKLLNLRDYYSVKKKYTPPADHP